MGSIPLHPSVVHVPLGLSIVLPFAAAALIAAWWNGTLPRRVLGLVLGLQLVVFVSAFVALRLGEQDEEKVERVVQEQSIESHEEAGQQFLIGTGVALLGWVVALLLQGRAARAGALAALAVTALVALLAVRAGKSGGELVYVHGAASAHSTPTASLEEKQEAGQPVEEDD